MKSKLIKLSESHYIIVNDSEIKGGYYWNELDREIRQNNTINHPYHKKITHSTQPLERTQLIGGKYPLVSLSFDKIKRLSLADAEAVEYGYNLYEMAEKCVAFWFEDTEPSGENVVMYRRGFRECRELLKDRVFTIKDIDKAYEAGKLDAELSLSFDSPKSRYIQSLLPKKEWDIEISEDGKIKLI